MVCRYYNFTVSAQNDKVPEYLPHLITLSLAEKGVAGPFPEK